MRHPKIGDLVTFSTGEIFLVLEAPVRYPRTVLERHADVLWSIKVFWLGKKDNVLVYRLRHTPTWKWLESLTDDEILL